MWDVNLQSKGTPHQCTNKHIGIHLSRRSIWLRHLHFTVQSWSWRLQKEVIQAEAANVLNTVNDICKFPWWIHIPGISVYTKTYEYISSGRFTFCDTYILRYMMVKITTSRDTMKTEAANALQTVMVTTECTCLLWVDDGVWYATRKLEVAMISVNYKGQKLQTLVLSFLEVDGWIWFVKMVKGKWLNYDWVVV